MALTLYGKKKSKPPKSKKISVIGDYVENINFNKIDNKIDVVVSTHNLEHIKDPFVVLKKLVEKFSSDTVFLSKFLMPI